MRPGPRGLGGGHGARPRHVPGHAPEVRAPCFAPSRGHCPAAHGLAFQRSPPRLIHNSAVPWSQPPHACIVHPRPRPPDSSLSLLSAGSQWAPRWLPRSSCPAAPATSATRSATVALPQGPVRQSPCPPFKLCSPLHACAKAGLASHSQLAPRLVGLPHASFLGTSGLFASRDSLLLVILCSSRGACFCRGRRTCVTPSSRSTEAKGSCMTAPRASTRHLMVRHLSHACSPHHGAALCALEQVIGGE